MDILKVSIVAYLGFLRWGAHIVAILLSHCLLISFSAGTRITRLRKFANRELHPHNCLRHNRMETFGDRH